jgi:amino acid permease
MSLVISAYAALLFFILTPGILLRLPKNGSKYTVALVHAVVFGFLFWLTHKFVWRMSHRLEGMTEGANGKDDEEKENNEKKKDDQEKQTFKKTKRRYVLWKWGRCKRI